MSSAKVASPPTSVEEVEAVALLPNGETFKTIAAAILKRAKSRLETMTSTLETRLGVDAFLEMMTAAKRGDSWCPEYSSGSSGPSAPSDPSDPTGTPLDPQKAEKSPVANSQTEGLITTDDLKKWLHSCPYWVLRKNLARNQSTAHNGPQRTVQLRLSGGRGLGLGSAARFDRPLGPGGLLQKDPTGSQHPRRQVDGPLLVALYHPAC